MSNKPPAGNLIPGLGFKPGEADCGRSIPQVLDVIAELTDAEIPSVAVGARALPYCGAKLPPKNWEICVPDECYEKAISLFALEPLDQNTSHGPRCYPSRVLLRP